MYRILVVGATGMLGSVLVPCLKKLGYEVVCHGFLGAADINADLTSYAQTEQLIRRVMPDVIVNLAALTDVDECQKNISKAFLLNTKIVENIANCVASRPRGKYLVHVSTDQLYDGTGSQSEDQVRMTNFYAMTKYAGELAAKRTKSIVLRTNFVGKGPQGSRKSFTDWVYNSCKKGDKIEVFQDIHFSPLAMSTLCEIICLAIERKICGLYNAGSRSGASKAEFAVCFAECLGFSVKNIVPSVSTNSKVHYAYRPKDMRMNSERLERELKISLPMLKKEIEKVVREYEQ